MKLPNRLLSWLVSGQPRSTSQRLGGTTLRPEEHPAHRGQRAGPGGKAGGGGGSAQSAPPSSAAAAPAGVGGAVLAGAPPGSGGKKSGDPLARPRKRQALRWALHCGCCRALVGAAGQQAAQQGRGGIAWSRLTATSVNDESSLTRNSWMSASLRP